MTLHGAEEPVVPTRCSRSSNSLTRQAPPAHFDTLLAEARTAGLPDTELARLERAVALADEVREGREQDAREQDARREAGLAALTDTARDLTFSYDLDSLLRVITRRARRLLGLDLAYVTLRGPHGACYVHTTEGSRAGHGTEGPRLAPGLRIAEGYGLGGAVQAHGEPVWTADYLADERFAPSGSLDAGVHAPAFDEDAEAALRGEDLHAIMAAPLRSGDTVIGALHGADRRVRDHTAEEIGLLAALADLAALAVEKAGLLDRTRAEVSELERDSSRVRTSLTRMRHVSEAHGRIMNLVLSGGDLCNVAKAAADALDATVMIRDQGGRLLATAGDVPGFDEEAVAKASLDAHARRRPVLADDDTWVAPVRAPAPRTSAASSSVPRRPHRRGRAAPRTRRPVRRLPPPHAALHGRRRRTRTRRTPRRPHRRPAARTPADGPAGPPSRRRPAQTACPRPRAAGGRRAGPGRGVGVLVRVPPHRPEDRAGRLHRAAAPRHRRLRRGEGRRRRTLPAARPPRLGRRRRTRLEPGRVARMYQEAGRCLDAMSALGGTGSAASVQDLGLPRAAALRRQRRGRLRRGGDRTVLDYDAERFTDLTHTLEAYFASGGSPTNAAPRRCTSTPTPSRAAWSGSANSSAPSGRSRARSLEVQLALRLQRTREVLASRATADPARQLPGPPERGN